ncbi:MAG: CarD family transcriptional regulator [Eubacteriales bacterium]|nr:CarD family transcriptional regulator [Eubacteriales bacterium]
MFKENDLIMYGGTGVCRVQKITKEDFGGKIEPKLYYILQPLYQTGVIYAPVDNDKVFMRPVISREQADELIDEFPDVTTEVFKSSSTQQLLKHYQSVIDSHELLGLVKLAKSIHQKSDDAKKQNRHIGQIDKKFMHLAEDLLFGELAAALKIPREDVTSYIHKRLNEA